MDAEHPLDVFVWKDGFWCFREEFSDKFLRDFNYRLIAFDSLEWTTYLHEPSPK